MYLLFILLIKGRNYSSNITGRRSFSLDNRILGDHFQASAPGTSAEVCRWNKEGHKAISNIFLQGWIRFWVPWKFCLTCWKLNIVFSVFICDISILNHIFNSKRNISYNEQGKVIYSEGDGKHIKKIHNFAWLYLPYFFHRLYHILCYGIYYIACLLSVSPTRM